MLAFLTVCLAVAVVAVPVPKTTLIPSPGVLVFPSALRNQFVRIVDPLAAFAEKEIRPAEELKIEPAEEAIEESPEPVARSEDVADELRKEEPREERKEDPREEERREEPKPIPAAPVIRPVEMKPIMVKLEDPAAPTPSAGLIGLLPIKLPELPFKLPQIPSLPSIPQLPSASSIGSFFPVKLPSWSDVSWLVPSFIRPGSGGSQRFVALIDPTYAIASDIKER